MCFCKQKLQTSRQGVIEKSPRCIPPILGSRLRQNCVGQTGVPRRSSFWNLSMARPRTTTELQQTRQIIFRLTEAEYAQLEAVAERAGLRVNELARRLTRRGQRRVVIVTTKRHDPAFIAQVRALGLNLNQLVHNAHIFGRVSPKVADVCEQIRKLVLAPTEDEEAA